MYFLIFVCIWITCPYSNGFLSARVRRGGKTDYFAYGSPRIGLFAAKGGGQEDALDVKDLIKVESPLERQIFCNVELNGANIEAVGFDMDFTLAQYNEAFDLLAFDGAKRKLLEMGYPSEVTSFKYSASAFRRGLVLDKSRGNILKVDRHKYVRKAYHGLTEVSRQERKDCYMHNVATYTESNYVNIDTLFLLIDALLFANLVDLKDRSPSLIDKSYEQLYRDVRHAVDMCHRDGAIKDAVMKDPSRHIIHDEGIVPMLLRLRAAGKKVFLLTNSMWEYTTVVMDYLVHHKQGAYAHIKWEDLFDVIIVGARKPAFLSDDYLALFQVDKTGVLRNIEDKDTLSLETIGKGNKVFQGGYWQDLHKMLGISSGDKILYVGDHMYADILRSKRRLGWRTCLVVPELEHELQTALQESATAARVMQMRRLQYDLDEYLDLLRQRIGMGVDAHEQLKEATAKSEELKLVVRTLSDSYNSKFNQIWGQLFKAGHQESRFGKQVIDYACLYTSRASNLGLVSPNKPFRPLQAEILAHDLILGDEALW